ncbi:MAG: spore coat protein [Peptococcaceae bacterium]
MNFQQQNQQKNMIKNPQSDILPQVKGPEMNDRDRCNDILATEKYLTDSFNIFTREASNQQLYNEIKKILNETHDCARQLFNVMFQEGWYKLQAAPQQEIQQAQQQFANYLQSQNPY